MNPSSALILVQQSIRSDHEYDYFAIHQERYRIILEKIQEITGNRPCKILDIGCFPYHVGKALELLGHDVYGIASSHEPVKNKNIAVVNIETEKFPHKNNFFDLVLCNEVLEHLPQSPLLAFSEIKRVLKPKGFFMVTTPNIVRSINRFKLLFGKQIQYPISVFFENEKKGNLIYHRHNREYVLWEVKDLMSSTDFRIKESGYFISYTPNRKKRIDDRFLLALVKWCNYTVMLFIPSLQDTLIVIGEKEK